VRLLRLSCSTFQCLVDDQRLDAPTNKLDLSPWLLQESFNTLCALTTVVVDECASILAPFPKEQKKLAQGVLDLLLHVLTVPQSAVTHLRTLGGAIQFLTKFGLEVFIQVVGDGLQHWLRIMLTLMNSISLAVRSISVDFLISLLGDLFKAEGNIDEVSIMMTTVLPEVIAREIALFSVSGLIQDEEEVESAVWPLRRSFADIEAANPLDDDRVDPQLVPSLGIFCRTCQAIIDGVLIEMRLKGDGLSVVGSHLSASNGNSGYTFDADEESLFEAASFFPAETAPLQKLRWLNSLKSLHESKGQWIEAAETLMLGAATISQALPHIRTFWRPSEFVLWHDDRRSLWLETIGKDEHQPDRGNVQVMEFAGSFLEPQSLFGYQAKKQAGTRKLGRPTTTVMSDMLTACATDAVSNYLKEEGSEELAYSRLESLLRKVMAVIEENAPLTGGILIPLAARRRLAEEDAALRKASAVLNSNLSTLAQRMSMASETPEKKVQFKISPTAVPRGSRGLLLRRRYYVRVMLSGEKSPRFAESTTIPTFLEWENDCVCRVPKAVVMKAMEGNSSGAVQSLESRICSAFGKPLHEMLSKEIPKGQLIMRTSVFEESADADHTGKTFLDIALVHVDPSSVDDDLVGGRRQLQQQQDTMESKRFFYRKAASSFALSQQGVELSGLLNNVATNMVELTVAHKFPCPLSRQRTVIASEIMGDR